MNIYFTGIYNSPSKPIESGREPTPKNKKIGKLLDNAAFIDSNFARIGDAFWRKSLLLMLFKRKQIGLLVLLRKVFAQN